MTRLIPSGSIILTPDDARVLFQVAQISKLRTAHRVGDTRAHAILTDITVAAFSTKSAEGGNVPRQSVASEEAGLYTVRDVAKATGRAERTVRKDALAGVLPGQRTTHGWVFRAEDCETYAKARRQR